MLGLFMGFFAFFVEVLATKTFNALMLRFQLI
jgi:hypothetical protein